MRANEGMQAENAKVGMMVVCVRGDYSVEIGVIKRIEEESAIVAYDTGDTCARTPWKQLRPVSNDYAAQALVQRMEQLGRTVWGLSEGCEDWSR